MTDPMTASATRAPDLAPKTCPRCGRRANFRYANATEAAKKSPLCWGESERDCPGYVKPEKEEAGQ